jgi:hypothetical protein
VWHLICGLPSLFGLCRSLTLYFFSISDTHTLSHSYHVASLEIVARERAGNRLAYPGAARIDPGGGTRTGLWVKPYQAEHRANR